MAKEFSYKAAKDVPLKHLEECFALLRKRRVTPHLLYAYAMSRDIEASHKETVAELDPENLEGAGLEQLPTVADELEQYQEADLEDGRDNVFDLYAEVWECLRKRRLVD